jgi:hypothetical protein
VTPHLRVNTIHPLFVFHITNMVLSAVRSDGHTVQCMVDSTLSVGLLAVCEGHSRSCSPRLCLVWQGHSAWWILLCLLRCSPSAQVDFRAGRHGWVLSGRVAVRGGLCRWLCCSTCDYSRQWLSGGGCAWWTLSPFVVFLAVCAGNCRSCSSRLGPVWQGCSAWWALLLAVLLADSADHSRQWLSGGGCAWRTPFVVLHCHSAWWTLSPFVVLLAVCAGNCRSCSSRLGPVWQGHSAWWILLCLLRCSPSARVDFRAGRHGCVLSGRVALRGRLCRWLCCSPCDYSRQWLSGGGCAWWTLSPLVVLLAVCAGNCGSCSSRLGPVWQGRSAWWALSLAVLLNMRLLEAMAVWRWLCVVDSVAVCCISRRLRG